MASFRTCTGHGPTKGLGHAPRCQEGNVQDADAGNPYTNTFAAWLDTSGVPLDLEGVDVAANGRLAALGFETYSGGTQTAGKIALIATQGVDQPPTYAVDCFLPAAGIARDASLSQDAGAIAWTDDSGVKVAGTPSTAADPCVMGSTPAVLSPTGTHPSIGGADVAAFLPTPTAQKPAASRGVKVKVKVGGPGKISIRGTVPARRVGRRGKPLLVATGKGVARAIGTVTIRLRFNALGRKRVRRLKGARLTLRIVHGSRSATKVVRLR